MNTLRVLTADDETLALRRLKLLLGALPAVEHVGEAASCADAVAKARTFRPDILLLDIQMRDGDGFSVIEALAQGPVVPIVILVTAFDHYAIRAFDSAVWDYLLKPVEMDRLASSLGRARRYLHAHDAEQRLSDTQEVVRNLRSALSGQSNNTVNTEFWLKTPGGMTRVAVDAIDSVSSEDDYVAIHTAAGSHLLRGSIRQFESRVERGTFIRVHRGWLARKTAIVNVRTRGEGGAQLTLRSGRKLPVGRVYLKQLRENLQRTSQRDPDTNVQ